MDMRELANVCYKDRDVQWVYLQQADKEMIKAVTRL
jgi:hypothetical protein